LSLSPKEEPYKTLPYRPDLEADTLYEKQMSNLQEVKARGGRIITVGTIDDEKLAVQSRFFVGIPEATWALNPILLSIPMQLLAYYIALYRGTDVDKPRNLAKSVTVE
jgi:glucosamine--fructose-6-phosphate aminotransferase (isomerizing)